MHERRLSSNLVLPRVIRPTFEVYVEIQSERVQQSKRRWSRRTEIEFTILAIIAHLSEASDSRISLSISSADSLPRIAIDRSPSTLIRTFTNEDSTSALSVIANRWIAAGVPAATAIVAS